MGQPEAGGATPQTELESAEERDDDARLASLEKLLADLEAELERDDPAAQRS